MIHILLPVMDIFVINVNVRFDYDVVVGKAKNNIYTLEHLKWNARRRSTRCLKGNVTDKSIEKHGHQR